MIRNYRGKLLRRNSILSVKGSRSRKYLQGDFGYWWTVEEGNEDVEGKEYKGNIGCPEYELTSLKGAPRKVSGNFYCGHNKYISLKGAPEYVGGNFHCTWCKNLTSLEGAPEYVGGNFWCYGCDRLRSLDHISKYIGGELDCGDCDSLTREDFRRFLDSDDIEIEGRILSPFGEF